MHYMGIEHPELREGEIYFGNDEPEGFERIGWKTKRLGKVAYDSNNQPYDEANNLFPIFVQKSELKEHGRNPDDQ